MNIHQKIVDLRQSRGWTQTELANKVGVSLQSISYYENGRVPRINTVIKMARVFEIDSKKLLDMMPQRTKNKEQLEGMISSSKILQPSKAHQVPIITTAQAKGWHYEYESICESVNCDMCETVEFYGSDIQEHWVAVRVDGDSMGDTLPRGSTVLVDMNDSYPKRGKRVLALLKTGDLVIKRYQRKDNLIRLESDGEGMRWEWNCKEESLVEWMHPIKKILIDES